MVGLIEKSPTEMRARVEDQKRRWLEKAEGGVGRGGKVLNEPHEHGNNIIIPLCNLKCDTFYRCGT